MEDEKCKNPDCELVTHFESFRLGDSFSLECQVPLQILSIFSTSKSESLSSIVWLCLTMTRCIADPGLLRAAEVLQLRGDGGVDERKLASFLAGSEKSLNVGPIRNIT